MTERGLFSVQRADETSDGEGVSIRRSLGLRPTRWHDPFLLLDEFYSDSQEPGPGFPDHPHRGFSTLTYMLKGKMHHKDNKGNSGTVGPGGFQWMTAARGIVHSETPAPEKEGLRGLQLWVNLPSKLKMSKPYYINGEADDLPEFEKDGAKIRVLAGSFDNHNGPVDEGVVDLHYFDIRLEPGATLAVPVPAALNAIFYVVDGAITLAEGQQVESATLGVLGDGDTFTIEAGKDGARIAVIAGHPIGEPIARYGPFVMTNRTEIEQAIADFQNGLF